MNKHFYLGIRGKILLGFFSLVIIFAISAAYNIFLINRSKKVLKDLFETKDPYLETLKDFEFLVSKSKMYTTNWVYLQKNVNDKSKLKRLLQKDYLRIKSQIQNLSSNLNDVDHEKNIHKIILEFEDLRKKEKRIMHILESPQSYTNISSKEEAESLLENSVIPISERILKNLGKVILIKKEEKNLARINLSTSYDNLVQSLIGIGIAMVLLSIITSFVTASHIVSPINKIKLIVQKLGNGEQPEHFKNNSKDEVGQIAKAVNRLTGGLSDTSKFAANIGKGNLESAFEPLSAHDILGNSLVEMRDNLKNISEEDKRRNWTTEGLAKFGDLLRSENNSAALCPKILSHLIKYLEANMGGIFLVNEDSHDVPTLTLVAHFAFDKKKIGKQKFEIGEGLIGQCFNEKETVLITNIPEEYISISSGLGMATPTCLLIVPIKKDDVVQGVLEIASFKIFEPFQLAFIEQLAENICVTITAMKSNERTQSLLTDAQMLTEQMRSQEEEMRQNLEELTSLQEESYRKTKSYEARFEALLNSNIAMVEFSSNGIIKVTNEAFSNMMGYNRDELIDKHHSILVDNEYATSIEYTVLWQNLANGQIKTGNFYNVMKNGSKIKIKSTYTPISDNGKVENIIKFATLV